MNKTQATVGYRSLFLKTLVVASVLSSGLTSVNFGSGSLEIWNQVPKASPLQKPIRSGYAPVNDIKLYYEIFSYGLMASDVLALMDYLNVPKASIVGWSDGAIIGLDIAINHPERVEKLVAYAANFSVSGLRGDVSQSSTFRVYSELVRQDYKRLSSTPDQYKESLAALREMWRTLPNYSPQQLASIKSPTLVLAGEYDEAIRRAHTEEMAHLIPGSKLEILSGVSHFAMLQNPEEFNNAVLEFLKRQ
jgi:pimeloyl-ACP methyl ester carboxylesterase